MSKEILGPELLEEFPYTSVPEFVYRPEAYAKFKHSFKDGGILIFHSEGEKKAVSEIVNGLPTYNHEDRKHPYVAVDIKASVPYEEAIKKLEEAGFKDNKPDKHDYLLEEVARSSNL